MLYLKIGLGLVTSAYALYLGILWKAESEIGPAEWGKVKTLLRYHIGIIHKEIGLITGYLLAYTLVLIGGYFIYSLTGMISRDKLARIITPGTTISRDSASLISDHSIMRLLLLKYRSKKCKLI
jgi:hypothetical protein